MDDHVSIRLGVPHFAHRERPTHQQREALSLISEMYAERRISTVELVTLLCGLLNVLNEGLATSDLTNRLDWSAGRSPS